MEFTDIGDLRPEIYRLDRLSFIELETAVRQLMNQFNLSVTQYLALVHLESPDQKGFRIAAIDYF